MVLHSRSLKPHTKASPRDRRLARPNVKPAAAPPLDLNLLAAFDALWIERSVTRAGKRVGLSQPAMSGALGRLRVMLNDPLFVRDKTGLRPTERAAQLAEPIAKALAALRVAVLPSDFEARETQRHFTIGCIDAVIAVIMPKVIASVLAEAPRVRIFVRPIDPSQAAQMLESGALDMAIVPMPQPPASIEVAKLFPIEGVLAMRKKHPLARAKSITQSDLTRYPHALVSFEGRTAGQLDEELAKEGLQRHVGVVVSSYLAIPHVLAGSDTLALLPKPFADVIEQEGALTTRPLPEGIRFPRFAMSLAWPRAHETSAASRWLRGHIQAAAERVGKGS